MGWLPRVLLIAAGALLLVYMGDYLSLVYRIPDGRAEFGTVRVQKVYAVKLKDKKTEYMFQPPEDERCVHSLFPHLGLTPCWYLDRHRRQEIDY